MVEKRLASFILTQSMGRGLVLGLSGGLDSAVVATICAKAVGKGKVLALILPEEETSPSRDIFDATEYADSLGIEHRAIDITRIYESFMKSIPRTGNMLAEGNVRARLRMAMLYYFANCERRIVVGTGDRSELAMGYFTKYGDGGVDILPIGGLYKTQVRKFAEYLGVPENILKKKSSPCLWKGQLAEDEIGIEYEDVDLILHLYLDNGFEKERILKELGVGWEDKVEKVLARVKENSHKLKMPPIANITTL